MISNADIEFFTKNFRSVLVVILFGVMQSCFVSNSKETNINYNETPEFFDLNEGTTVLLSASSIPISIYELNNELIYKKSKNIIRVTYQIYPLDSYSKKEITPSENGIYNFQEKTNNWVSFEITTSLGEVYIRKELPQYLLNKDLGIYFYVGKTNYIDFSRGRLQQFNPFWDKVYLVIKGGQMSGLKEHNISRISENILILSEDENKRQSQISFLTNSLNNFEIAPLANYSSSNTGYFSNSVEILVNRNMTDIQLKEINKKYNFKTFYVVDFDKGNEDFEPSKRVIVSFHSTSLIDYVFLKQLEELYNNKNILRITTGIIPHLTQD